MTATIEELFVNLKTLKDGVVKFEDIIKIGNYINKYKFLHQDIKVTYNIDYFEKYIERCIFVYKINDIEIRIILEEDNYFGLWTNLSPTTEDDVVVPDIDKLLETLPIIEELFEKIKK